MQTTWREPTRVGLWVAATVVGLLAIVLVSSLSGAAVNPSAARATSSTPTVTVPKAAAAPPATASRAPATNPAADLTLSAAGQSPAAIDLQWGNTATGTFENYTVQEASQASKWKLASVGVVLAQGTTSFALAGVSPSVDYDWAVTEYYESCFLFDCTQESEGSNLLNLTQPAVAYLNYTDLTSTSALLEWTNNASYGGSITFVNYTVWEETNGSAPAVVTTVTDQSTLSYEVTLRPATSYSFFVQTTDCATGCATAAPVNSTTQSNIITLGTPRVLSVNLVAARETVDYGETDYFTCTPTGGKAPFAYSWDFGGSGYATGPASQSVILADTPSEAVNCEVTDAEPKVNSTSVLITVNPLLVVIDSENRTTADAGQSVEFECSVSGGTSPYDLTWSFGDGGTTTLETADHAYDASGNYAPTCSVTDGASIQIAPALGIVISPALVLLASSSSTAAAPGTALTFTASVANGTGTYTAFTWTFGPDVTATGASVVHTFTASGTYPVVVRVGDSNGVNVTQAVSEAVTPIAVQIGSPGTTVDVGHSVTFTATASGGAGGPYNYTWHFGDGTVGYGVSVTHTYSTTGTVSPQLTVTDRLGATNSSTLASISVVTPALPYAWFSGWVLVAIALVIGAIIALFVLTRRRSAETAEAEAASSAYVPPTDPSQTIRGAKVCTFCGASNLPLRTTCSTCGKSLPRAPAP